MKKSNGNERIAKLIMYLRRTQSSTVSEMAALMEVSERTIRNDIKQINLDFSDCAVIEKNHSRYSLRIFDESLFLQHFGDASENMDSLNSPENRMNYIFGRLMRAEEPVLTDELAYEMNIGRTTLVNDLNKLRAQVEPYNISVIGKTSKGLMLQGLEMDIRRFILENNFNYLYRDYPMDQDITDVIQDTLLSHSFEKNVRESFKNFMFLMLDRFLTGHYIGHLTNQFYNLTSRPEFEVVNEMTSHVEDFLKISIPVEEKLFVFLPIIGMRTPTDVRDMQLIELDETVRPLMMRILRAIRDEMQITIRSGDFTEEFLYHLMFMINRLRFRVKVENPMLQDLKEKYPLAYQMAGIASRVIEEEYHIPIPEEERGFLASYFGVFLTAQELDQPPKRFRVAVVCGTGRVTARLIGVQLKKILDSSAELTLMSDEKVTAEQLNEFDIILTTVDLQCSCSRPVIRINEIFNEKELLHKIEKARYWDDIDVPVLDNNWYVMTALLDESKFFFLKDAASYEQAIDTMVDSLIRNCQVDINFGHRLYEREKKGTMIFDNAIAIPHGIQYAGKHTVLAIGVLPKPLYRSGVKIQIIFMLGLPEKVSDDDTLLLRVYDEIMTIAHDPAVLEKIASAENFQMLLRALYKDA